MRPRENLGLPQAILSDGRVEPRLGKHASFRPRRGRGSVQRTAESRPQGSCAKSACKQPWSAGQSREEQG